MRDLEAAQQSKMDEVINLTNNEDNFRTVSYRKKTRSVTTKYFGESENSDFATERKAWLCLYRIKRHVTTDKIRKFITDQPIFKVANITVKELPTNEHHNKRFMFGIDWHLKDEIYKPSTWPKGMAFKRFDFKKFHNYVSNSPEDF